jgi:hypothetical protein
VKFIAEGKYGYKGQYFRKGDVFDVDPAAFVPSLMLDLTPKPIVAVKTEVSPAPKEEKTKATEKKKSGVGA